MIFCLLKKRLVWAWHYTILSMMTRLKMPPLLSSKPSGKQMFISHCFFPMGATWKHSPGKTAAAAAQLQFLVTKSLWVAMGSKVLSALDLDVPKQLLSFRPWILAYFWGLVAFQDRNLFGRKKRNVWFKIKSIWLIISHPVLGCFLQFCK